jgi:hypothetical protein
VDTWAILLLIGIFVVVIGGQGLVWLLIFRRARKLPERLRAELSASGEQLLKGPDRGWYRGGTGGFTRVRGMAAIALTRSRLIFRKVIGRAIEVPVEQIVGLREDKWFLTQYRSGRIHMIVKTLGGDEVGFMVDDVDGWRAALQQVTAKGERTTPTP